MPKVIDNFVLEEKIGSGQFGDVFKGYNQQTKQQVAIKTIKRDTIKGKFYQLLQNEIKVLKTCDNPNIIKLYAIKKTANHFYLMLEYCNGGDMLAYVRKHSNLADDQIIKFVCEILNGFQTLVKHRIMHRDFKLANILLHNGSVKIADFGFAKLLSSEDYTTTILGSPLNMAPQVLGNNKYNSKADIWSIGACIFEIITGKPPYVASNMVDLLKLIKSSQPHYPSKIHPMLKQLLKKMLVVDPKRRISWNDIFAHPINTYLQNKMQKQINLELVEDESLLLNTSKYYLKKNLVINSTENINQNSQVNNYLLNVIEKGQKEGQFQPNAMKKKITTSIQQSQQQSSKQKISDSQLHQFFRKNSKKILYYRNIYAFLAKVADDIVKRTDIKQFQLAAYALGQKILGMISWLNELCQMTESPLQGLEYWEIYITRAQFKEIRNYINKQYEVFEIFNQSLEPLIKSKLVQGNYTNQQAAKTILVEGITHQSYQQLLLAYGKQLAKRTSSEMLKKKQTEGYIDDWIHLQQLMIARKVNEVFSTKNEDFDFKQFYSEYESISLENVLLKFESMYKNA